MNLPSLLVITDRHRMAPTFEAALLAALQGGARWIQIREKDLSPREVLARFAKAQRIAEKFQAITFLNGRADLARAAHADGLHLPENEAPVEVGRLVLGHHTPCGVSVHSKESALRAAGEGADYLLFGSVFPTQSHPGLPGQGLLALTEIAAAVSVPVYAIGGINEDNACQCLQAGAKGVAVISSVWEAPNIQFAVRNLRDALGDPLPPSTHSTLPAHLR